MAHLAAVDVKSANSLITGKKIKVTPVERLPEPVKKDSKNTTDSKPKPQSKSNEVKTKGNKQ